MHLRHGRGPRLLLTEDLKMQLVIKILFTLAPVLIILNVRSRKATVGDSLYVSVQT